jgi:hypothetical protein
MSDSVTTGGRKKTAWQLHVKSTMASMSGEKSKLGKKWFGHVLKTAKKSYKKHKGGEDSESDEEKTATLPATEMGGRRHRKRGGKTRRHKK